MSNAPELLPCPFCGDEAWTYWNDRGITAGYVGQCRKCGCESGPPRKLEDAVAYWNTRAALPPKVKALEWWKSELFEMYRSGKWVVRKEYNAAGNSFWVFGESDFSISTHQTCEVAKAAAQAHHEARVLACLDMRPTTQKGE